MSRFSYPIVAVAPSPADSGLSLTVEAGYGAQAFPPVPFDATVWPADVDPLEANSETVRVTAKAGDVFTVTRQQDGPPSRAILTGDQIAAVFTETLRDGLNRLRLQVGEDDIVSLAWSKLTGTPTTLAGYGITDPVALTSGSYADPAWLTSLAASKLTGTVAVAQGGTGLASYAVGDLLYASGATALSQLAAVAVGQVLVSGGVTTAPAWSATPTLSGITFPTTALGTLPLLALQPSEVGAPPFKVTVKSYVNTGDPRLNQVLRMGWNVNASGSSVDATKATFYDSWESFYQPAGAALIERHWEYYNPTGSVTRRPFSSSVDPATNVSSVAFATDMVHFAPPAGGADWMDISSAGLRTGLPIEIKGVGNIVQLLVRGVAGQTLNIAEWQTSTPATKVAITSTGRLELYGSGIPAVSAQLAVTSGGLVSTLSLEGAPVATSGTVGTVMFALDTTGMTSTSGWQGIDLNHVGTFANSGQSSYLRLRRSGTNFFDLNSSAELIWKPLASSGFASLQYNGVNSDVGVGFFRGTNAQGGISLRNALTTDDGTGVGFRLSVTTTAAYTAVTNRAAKVLVLGTGQGGFAVDVFSVTAAGKVGINTATALSMLHLPAGSATANTAPLQFTSGALETVARAGVVEFLTDTAHLVITTGAARKAFVLDDGARLTSGKMPVATVNGRLIDGPTWGARETYTETNVTTDRAYDANATTLDELADVLGTLIADLRAKNMVA